MPVPSLEQCKRTLVPLGAVLVAFAGVWASPASAATAPPQVLPKAHAAPGKSGARSTPVLAPARPGAFGTRRTAGFNTWATLYNGSGVCVRATATISHVIPNSWTFGGNQATTSVVANTQGCGAWLASPILSSASRLEVHKWSGSAWYVCRSTDWTYRNTGVTRSGDLTFQSGASSYLDYGGKASCGAGYYGTLGYGYVFAAGAWRGGSVWSGYDLVS